MTIDTMTADEEWVPKEMVVQFAMDNPDVNVLEFVREDPEGTDVSHISMGRMNFVFRVRSRDGASSLIIKHSRDYSRTVPWVQMNIRRQEIEYSALKVINDISPGSAPLNYCFDMNHNIIAMEDLGHMELLGAQIRRGEIDSKAISGLGSLIYRIHHATSKDLVSPQQWADVVTQFKDDGLRSSIRSFQLDRSLEEGDPSNLLRGEVLNVYRNLLTGEQLETVMRRLIHWYNTDTDCLVQADCHENAVFVQKGHCAIFDLEFCFLGHRAAHLAIPIRDLILAYHCTQDATFRASILSGLRALMESYLEGYDQAYNNRVDLMTKITAFTGAFLFRMAIRHPMTEDWLLSADTKISMMKLASRAMIMHESVTSLDEFLDFFVTSPNNYENIQ